MVSCNSNRHSTTGVVERVNVIEELLIRAVDDMTGSNLSGMNNDRYNYGPGSRDSSHGRENTEAFEKLLKSIKKKCKGK